ncbi:hypothetical protein [Microbacterium sp. PM5]|uniref:hypothetical protein n=1 Tax=Microbacterium sp. PM5 TaxID=2014534 RepID=UPI000DD14467|nr:hypothetical protein [Microbacterium sp. PM5]AXA95421.1 hypothetical protein CEP17_02750 [Microbacterium sp. PM5]
MSEFIASNGVPVIPDRHGGYQFVREPFQFGNLTGITADAAEALRQFFQKEEDDRLGRWRWPANPDYVVYALGAERDGWRVVNEATGNHHFYAFRTHAMVGSSQYAAAARAFFGAHPEPKPWHSAKPGEGWLLTIDGEERVAVRGAVEDFVHEKGVTPWSSPTITSGRRIWPEVAS